MAAPTLQAVGTGHETSVAPPTHAAGDWMFLPVEHDAGTVPTPAGWTIVPGFPVVQSAATHLSLFMRKATSGAEGNAAISGGTDHQWGVIFTVRGADLTDPIHASATAYQVGSTTAAWAPGLETDEADCLVIHILGWGIDDAGPIASSWANTSLTGVTEQYDAGTITGDGGGITIASGTLATAGAVTRGTVTTTPTFFACATLAIRPPASAAGGGVSRARVVNV